MGKEYKKRIKEQYGRPSVLAYETLEVGGTIAPAATGPVSLSDRQSISTYTATRPLKLEGLTMQVSSALTAGSGDVSVRAVVNGVAVGSGTIDAGDSSADVIFATEADAEINLVLGDTLLLDVSKNPTNVVRTLTVRAGLRLFEL